MSKKMAVAFGNIYMAAIRKTQILSRKRGIDDDIFSLWDINRQEIREHFVDWHYKSFSSNDQIHIILNMIGLQRRKI